MYLINIPDQDLRKIASRSGLRPEVILRKTRRVIQLLNSDLRELALDMVKNTKQKWVYEVLLSDSRVEDGKFCPGEILGNVGESTRKLLGEILLHAPKNCRLHHTLDLDNITEMDITQIKDHAKFMKFFRRVVPCLKNLETLKSSKLNVNLDIPLRGPTKRLKLAQTLSKCDGEMEINLGISQDPEILREIFSSKAFRLTIFGEITHRPDEVFEGYCTSFKGLLRLPELQELNSEALARALCRRESKLVLDFLEKISDPVAETLASLGVKLHAPILEHLCRGTKLEDWKPCHVLLRKGERLDLSVMTNIPRCLWKVLSLHDGPLLMNGLENIEDEFALLLSRHKHELQMKSLKYFSEKASKALKLHGKATIGTFMQWKNPELEMPF